MLFFALQKNIWKRNCNYYQYSIVIWIQISTLKGFFVTQAFWVFIERVLFFGVKSGLLEISEWEPCMWYWTQTSWHLLMQRDSYNAGSGKPRIVLYCVKKSINKPVAVLPQVLKIHCYCETVTSVSIKRLLCRLLFTQYKNTWLVRIRLCRLVG